MRQFKISKKITDRDNITVDRYLKEIANYDLLSSEEEVKLAQKSRAGDVDAFYKLVNCNLRFVVSVAKQHLNQGLELPDLINEGNLGLIKAAKKFDETKGFKLISYAVNDIRASILYSISLNRKNVRLPSKKHQEKREINKAVFAFEQEFEREPTLLELEEIVGIKKETISILLQHNKKDLSINYSNYDSNEEMTEYLPQLATEPDWRELENEDLKLELKIFLEKLNKRDYEIMSFIYGLNGFECLTYKDIGEKYNMTPTGVRTLEGRVLKKIKTLTPQRLRQYL